MMNLLRKYALLLVMWGPQIPSYFCGIEFTAGSFTDVTTRVLRASWALAIVDFLHPPNPQTGLIDINNTDGTMSPRINANLKPGKAVKLTATPNAAGLFNNTATNTEFAQTVVSCAYNAASGCTMAVRAQINSFWSTTQAFLDHTAGSGTNTNKNKQLYFDAGLVRWKVIDGTGAAVLVSDPTTPTLGVGRHWAGTAFPGSYMALYRDGVLVGSTALLVGSLAVNSGALRVGALGNDAGGYRLSGVMDDVSVFTRGLSPTEIGSLVSMDPRSIDSTYCVTYYDFSDGNDITIGGLTQNNLDALAVTQQNWTTGMSGSNVITYPLFFGRITDISVSPIHGARTTVLSVVDEWDRIARITYNSSLYNASDVKSIFTELMSMSSVKSFTVDGGINDVTGFLWYRDTPATQALQSLVDVGMYFVQVDGNGTFNLRNRYWALFSSSVGTFSNAEDLQMTLSKDTVINQSKMNGLPRAFATNIATVATLPSPLQLPSSGQAISFWMVFQDPEQPSFEVPVQSLVTPIQSTDYFCAANSDGTGGDVFSTVSLQFTPYGASCVATLYCAGNGGWLTRFQVRAYPAERLAQIGAQFDVSTSQTAFGIKNYTIDDAPIQNQPYLQSLAQYIASARANGIDEIQYTLNNEYPDVIRNNPGDLFSLVENFTGYVTQWRIREAQHELDLTAGHAHRVTWIAEAYDQSPFFVLDDTTRGALDNGRELAI